MLQVSKIVALVRALQKQTSKCRSELCYKVAKRCGAFFPQRHLRKNKIDSEIEGGGFHTRVNWLSFHQSFSWAVTLATVTETSIAASSALPWQKVMVLSTSTTFRLNTISDVTLLSIPSVEKSEGYVSPLAL
jgi:hypothetical protein